MSSATVVPSAQPVGTGGSTNLILCIVIPVGLVALAVATCLSIVIFWLVRKRHLKQTTNYRPIPSEDSFTSLSAALGRGIPFPPRVQVTTPMSPRSVQPGYTTANQLSSHTAEMNTDKFRERYPFIQHTIPVSQETKEDKRPLRLRTRRKGNHKHGRGRNIVMRRSETVDSEHSPGPDGETTSRDPSPLPPLPPSAHPKEFIVPAKQTESPPQSDGSPLRGSEGNIPQVFLSIKYTETNNLVIRVQRVKCLPLRDDGGEVDAYIRVYFTPVFPNSAPRRTSKTRMERRNSEPVYDEDITYESMSPDELAQTTLHIEALDFKSFGKHVLLGLNEIALNSLQLTDEPTNISVPLKPPPETSNINGTVLLSMCFEPDNRKLSLIILRAKDLNNNNLDETDPLAKVAISLKDRVLTKLKTKKKTNSCSPIFNEALSCTVGSENIHYINVTVTMSNENRQSCKKELGTIVLGSDSTGDELRHWNDTISSPGKHIAEWHDLCSDL